MLKEEECRRAAKDAAKSLYKAQVMESVLNSTVRATEDHCAETVSTYKRHAESARRSNADMSKKQAQYGDHYTKCVLAETNAEDMLQTAMITVTTAVEILAASAEIIHELREAVGELGFPLTLKADVKKIGKNFDELRTICRKKKVVMKNSKEVSTLTNKMRRVEKALVETDVQKSKKE